MFPISIIFSLQEWCINGIIQYINFYDWIFSLIIILWRIVRLLLCVSIVCFNCWVFFHGMDVPQIAKQFSCWRTSRLFPIWGNYEWSCHKHFCTIVYMSIKSLFLWDKWPGVKSLDCMIDLYFVCLLKKLLLLTGLVKPISELYYTMRLFLSSLPSFFFPFHGCQPCITV